MRLLAATLVVAAVPPFYAKITPLPAPVRSEVQGRGYWQPGCPLPLAGLRLLTVRYIGFDEKPHRGQLVVNAGHAPALAKVFRKLYALRFQIHHMHLSNMYGPPSSRPADGDVTGSFSCRKAVPSPCGGGSGNWSMHAYGLAVDLNPVENPYVGCGMTRDKTALSYLDRSRVRPGMVTPEVVAAFRSVGWRWGGDWTGATKDYMHFSSTGH